MDPPIVDLGFSEEFEEEAFGVPEEKGVDMDIPGMVDFMKDLSGLGIDDFAAAHDKIADSLEGVWDNFLNSSGSDFAILLGDFVREENVRERLLEKLTAYPAYYMKVHDPWLAGALTAFGVYIQAIDIIFNDLLPYLEQSIDNRNRDLKLHIDKAIEEKLGDDDGGSGGGSYSEDDIDRVVDDAIDDFFDDADEDDFEPDDFEDFDFEFEEMDEMLDEFEADLDVGLGPLESDESDTIKKLREQINGIRARLAGLRSRMEGWPGTRSVPGWHRLT